MGTDSIYRGNGGGIVKGCQAMATPSPRSILAIAQFCSVSPRSSAAPWIASHCSWRSRTVNVISRTLPGGSGGLPGLLERALPFLDGVESLVIQGNLTKNENGNDEKPLRGGMVCRS